MLHGYQMGYCKWGDYFAALAQGEQTMQHAMFSSKVHSHAKWDSED